MKLLAVTACPTGIAHTYMAAEQLEKAAKNLGHSIKVETQGAMGIENKLGNVDIEDADGVIFAVGIPVQEMARFEGIKHLKVSVQDAIKRPDIIIKEISSSN